MNKSPLSLEKTVKKDEIKSVSVLGSLIFAICTVIFTMLAVTVLEVKIVPVLPVICFVLSFAVRAVSERFSKWFALVPALVSAGIAMIFTRFTAELYFIFDRAGNILAENNHILFFKTAEKTAQPLLFVIVLSLVLSSAGSLVPQKLYLLFLAVCGAVFSGCFNCLNIYVVLLCAVAAVCICADLKTSSFPSVLFAGITAAVVSAVYFLVPYDFGKNKTYNVPDCELEAVLENPQPMYLRERTLQSGEPAVYSETFYWLYEEDFSPLTQAKNLTQTIGEPQRARVTVNIKKGSMPHILVPYGAVDCENISADKNSLGGDYPIGNTDFYSYEIAENYVSDCFKNLSELSENTEISEEYLRLEQLYRDYVYGEFTEISSKDSKTASAMGVAVKPSVTEKLKEVRDYFSENIIPDYEKSEEPQSFSRLCQVSQKGNDLDYACSAVVLLRYEELPARLCGGYVIDRETAESVQPNEAVTLTAENYHCWAEFYLDGIGWIPLEVFPDYIDMIDFSPYGGGDVTAKDSTGTAEDSQTSQMQQIQKIPENASEISDSDIKEKTSYVIAPVVSAAAALLAYIVSQRVKALIKRKKRRSSDALLRANANHVQALNLLAVLGADITLLPEKLAVSSELCFDEQAKETYIESEKVMSKAFYSDKKITLEDARKCEEFYKSVRKLMHDRLGALRKIRLILFRGIY